MNKRTLLGATALRSFAAIGLTAGMFSPALAQEVPAEEDPPVVLDSEQEVESGAAAAPGTQEIVVTGSRIRRPNLESPLPVTSVGGEEFFQTGNVSVGDTLNDLPALRSTFSQANSTRFLGTSGLNLLDLRGLGTVRTLVLVNGRRHVGGDVLSSGVSVDTNTMPTDLIERVDVVTGGNSAVYGSDAIAGVVNFILKRDFEGFQLRAQGGASRYEDAGSYFIAGLWGRNFFDGRANVAVNVEYARQEDAYAAERPWFRTVFTVVDSDPAGTPNGSDGVPDRIINRDFRSATFNTTGNLRINTGQCGVDPQGTPYLCAFIFTPEGNLVPQTGTRTGLGPNGQFIGGNGEGFFSGTQVQVYPQLDRINVNLTSQFEVAQALVPFIEAKYSRTDSYGTGASGAFFIAGAGVGVLGDPFQFIGGYNREQFSINNPFLTDQARTEICAQRALAGLTCTATTRFSTQQQISSLSARREEARRDTYRVVGGVRGDIGGPWNYELSLNYGRLDEQTRVLGNVDAQRFLLAMDAVRDPTTGNIVCRSQIDANAAVGYYPWFYGTDPNADARLANDVANCVPINVLGNRVSQAARDYVLNDTTAFGKTSQFNALAFISGDSSQFFELPGGPIGVVIGAEYREDNLYYDQDDEITLGYTFYNAIPTFEAPKSKVKEAFGEIRVPLLRDLPFFNELEVSAAGRVSDYNLGLTGTVYAYNANAIWSPVRGLRFRGNYARSVRAPNQVELFSPFGQNFSLVNDPCDVNQIGTGTANRAANCAAAGVPAGTAIQYSSSLPFLSGGFTGLEAEKSDSYTLGGVLTPAFLPGFSFSADYYDIKVNEAISAVTAQFFLNQCYDLAAGNPFCTFERGGPAPNSGGHGGVPFGIVPNSLQIGPVNFAKLTARGLDFEVAYRNRIGDLGRLDTRLTYTRVLERTNFLNPNDPNFGNRVLSELGDPQDAFNWNSSFQRDRFTLGYQMRYIGRMVVNNYEDFFEFEGRPPQNADFYSTPWFKEKFYHDVRLGIDVGRRYNFYMGVDNVTDTQPPFATSGIGAGSAIYDVRGRFFYAGAVAKF